jgi:hypothetical protein
MKISAAFPSEYLKAADLQGRQVKVVIDRVEMRDVGDDHKPVLFFQGKDRGVVLNKTNSAVLEDAFGDETDHWHGQKITLYPTKVDFQGKRVDAIRLMADPVPPPVQQQPRPQSENPAPIDDDIPF